MSGDPRPVLFVTNHAPAFRTGAFAALHAQQDVVFALIGGDVLARVERRERADAERGRVVGDEEDGAGIQPGSADHRG